MPDLHKSSPNLLDLNGAMALAADSVLHRLDEKADYRPWFSIKGRDGVPAFLEHGPWDLGDMTGRYLEAMVLARRMLGPRPEWSEAEERLLRFLLSLLRERGLVTNIDRDAPDHMFAQGSALFGLVARYEDSGDPELQRTLERFVDALAAHSQWTDDYRTYPEIATPQGCCSHMAGEQILPLLSFYRLTGYEPALDHAVGLSRWAFFHDPTFGADGVIRKTGWEGHLHAWMDTLCGVLECARLSGEFEVEQVAERCRLAYDWARSTCATDFGWVPDFPGSPTCETCAISSTMRLAMELVREGHEQYWNDLERFARNQLVENQFRGPGPLSFSDSRVASAFSGSFDSWAYPNSLLASVPEWGKTDDGTVEGCCVNGGMRGIWLAWDNALTEDDNGLISVNLLVDRENSIFRVESRVAGEGRLLLSAREPTRVQVRLPDWANPSEARLNGQPVAAAPDHRITFPMQPGDNPTELTFPQRRITTTSAVAGVEYTVTWQGDSVRRISPPGEKYPIYQR